MKRPGFHLPDTRLWEDVASTVKPLGRSNHPVPRAKLAAPVSAKQPGSGSYHHPEKGHAHHKAEPPPLGGLDRRLAQRLTRGQLEPEGRIDLHGENVEQARIKLHHFIVGRRERGDRLVLVITGKGPSPFGRHTLHGAGFYHAPEREGRLRRELPFWLEEGAFRIHVAAYQPAHPRHGGGGAFYVWLRRLPHV